MKLIRETHVWRAIICVASKRARSRYVHRKLYIIADTQEEAELKIRSYAQECGMKLYGEEILFCRRIGGKRDKTIV